MAVEKSAGLVLGCRDWSETSQVVHLLARDAGRFRCLAKGAKRPKNAFGGPLDRWILGQAVFSRRDPGAPALAVLREFYETERFAGLRRRLEAYYAASLVTELVTALTAESDPSAEVFDLTVRALRDLSTASSAACRAVAYAFGWRLLALAGYGPDLARCVVCGRAVEKGGALRFSGGLGGPVCRRCRVPADACTLKPRTVEAMRFLLGAPWEEIPRVRLGEATRQEVRTALERRVAELAGKEPSAARYV